MLICAVKHRYIINRAVNATDFLCIAFDCTDSVPSRSIADTGVNHSAFKISNLINITKYKIGFFGADGEIVNRA